MCNSDIELRIFASLEQLRGKYTSEETIDILLLISSVQLLYLKINRKERNNVQEVSKIGRSDNIELNKATLLELESKIPNLEGVLSGLFSDIIERITNKDGQCTDRNVEDIWNETKMSAIKEPKYLIKVIEAALERVANEKESYITPKIIRELIIALCDINNVSNFADYCCGTASIGRDVLKYAQFNNRNLTYYGCDINIKACLLTRLFMEIYEVDDYSVANIDVLEDVSDRRFDLVICDMPQTQSWAGRLKENECYKYGVPSKTSADLAFIQNIIYHLSSCGKAIVVATKGTLVRASDQLIREQIINKDLIEVIITLPPNLYYHTNIGTELIIINKHKEEKLKGKILFIDAEKSSYRINRNQYSIKEDAFNRIVNSVKNSHEEKGFSRIVSLETIVNNSCSLNPAEYLNQISFKNSIELNKVAKVVRGLQLTKDEAQQYLKQSDCYYLNVKDIDNERIRYDENSKIILRKREWLEKYSILPDDIIITSKGTTIKMAIVGADYKQTIISSNLTLIRVDPRKYNAYVLYEFLQSDKGRKILESIQTGTTIKVLNVSKLEKLLIPALDFETMRFIGERAKQNKLTYEKTIDDANRNFTSTREYLLAEFNDKIQ